VEKVVVDKVVPIDEISASRIEEVVFTPELDETNAVQNVDNQSLQLEQELVGIEQEAASLAHSPVQSFQQEGNQQAIEQQAATPESVVQQPLSPVQQEPNVQAIVNDVSNNQAADNLQNSPVSAVLATRNMLRSRKKQLESTEKKSSGAEARQTPSTNQTAQKVAPTSVAKPVKAIEPAPEAPYQPEKIDPAIVRKANQVDKWAHMIDSMELTARIRQLAIHATIDENSTDDNLVLRLNQSTKHLYTDIAKQQLEQSLCEFLSKPITVTIEIVEKTIEDPYQIQSQIDDKRYDYAKTLLKEDSIVVSLQDKFQASLDESSIAAL
jgi:DNA polymerase-3 subunit gamma/tau